MDAICFVLHTGCQWNALNQTGICSSRSAHRRFQEEAAADVCVELWKRGVTAYDPLQGIDWEWLAMDGARPKAPLGGEKGGPEPDRPREGRRPAGGVGFTAHIRARGEEAQALQQEAGDKTRRGVVERTHSWMNRFRRILLRWDKKVWNYLAFLHLACASLTYRQSGLLG